MNLVAYSLPLSGLRGNVKKRIPEIRDSIGKTHIPGRLKGSYMITEKAYRPYYYKTQKEGRLTYLTKGTWEVANDFMACNPSKLTSFVLTDHPQSMMSRVLKNLIMTKIVKPTITKSTNVLMKSP